MMRALLSCATLVALGGCMNFDQFVGPGGSDAGADAAAAPDAARTPPDLFYPRVDLGDVDLACLPGTFLGCSSDAPNLAVVCNDAAQRVPIDCGGPCVGPDSCGLCDPPGSTVCSNAVSFTCTDWRGLLKVGACPTLGGAPACLDERSCTQCVGATVCGVDGVWNTRSEVQYGCLNGVVDVNKPLPCDFGCDPKVGRCRDFVPLGDAMSHLGMGDAWSCYSRGQNVASLIT